MKLLVYLCYLCVSVWFANVWTIFTQQLIMRIRWNAYALNTRQQFLLTRIKQLKRVLSVDNIQVNCVHLHRLTMLSEITNFDATDEHALCTLYSFLYTIKYVFGDVCAVCCVCVCVCSHVSMIHFHHGVEKLLVYQWWWLLVHTHTHTLHRLTTEWLCTACVRSIIVLLPVRLHSRQGTHKYNLSKRCYL